MVMTYDGALVMPSSYAVMEQEEMTYVEGGWCIESKWWGYNIYLTHKERQELTSGQTIAGLVAGLASCGVGAAVVGAVATIIWNYDDGYGVKIRMTGNNRKAIITGVSTLTREEELSIASKNLLIR